MHEILLWIIAVLSAVLTVLTTGHVLLFKRDPASAFGWIIVVVLLFPVGGPFLYFIFGVNRVQTRAKKLDKKSPHGLSHDTFEPQSNAIVSHDYIRSEFISLAKLSGVVTRRALLNNNRIIPLHNGENAYPAMLEAIKHAKHCILLASYIFDTNHTGRQFIQYLENAQQRGIEVFVLIDGAGELYSYPRVSTLLKTSHIPVSHFLPPKLLPPTIHMNLRNHRKLLIVDGHTAFTGGMNIGDRHLSTNANNRYRVIDMHFKINGPVVKQMEQVFINDWLFTTGVKINPAPITTEEEAYARCRTIITGPNEDIDKLTTILVSAIAAARQSIYIMTPYFLPSRELLLALHSAAMRGVVVNILLPERNNLPFVHWATLHALQRIIHFDVHVYLQPPPFVHSKLFIIDNYYCQIGSANVDSRSLRLNFELVIECYDGKLATELKNHCEGCIRAAKPVTQKWLKSMPLWKRLRNSSAWLFSPYL